LPLQNRYLHLLPVEQGECLPSWLLRISNRTIPNFRDFSTIWLADPLRVTPGFDAFPAASLLTQIGAIQFHELDYYVTHHTLLGTTKIFYNQSDWQRLVTSHGAESSRIYILRRKSKQRTWHVCPHCRSAELERGHATWQCVPQITGLFYCPLHESPIVTDSRTRNPPIAAPSVFDLSNAAPPLDLSQKEDHILLAKDIAAAVAIGECHRASSLPFRDSLALELFGCRWLEAPSCWPVLKRRFGKSFLDTIQIKPYNDRQSCHAHLYPSVNGIVYLAALARAFDTNLPDLLEAVNCCG